ncbi:MAG: glycosyltransferase [Bacteroidota bacterium]
MRLTIVLPDVGLGGAQRIALTLAAEWKRLGWTVSIVTICPDSPVFALPDGVDWHPLPEIPPGRPVRGNLARFRQLRRMLDSLSPEVVVSLLPTANVLALMAGLGRPWRTVVAERAHPTHAPISRPWAVLRRLFYPLAHAVVTQTNTAKRALGRVNRRMVVIPNPVAAMPAAAGAVSDLPRPYILAVGRLSEEKRYDNLIDAFGVAASRIPAYHLIIAGPGEAQAELEAQARRLGLAERVHLVGFVSDVGTLYGGAELFVMSSRYEGFPNALCEAMAAGVPVISTDCESGPADIVRPGVDGVLVPVGDITAMADAIAAMAADDDKRRAMGLRGREIADRFGLKTILAKWSRVLEPTNIEG